MTKLLNYLIVDKIQQADNDFPLLDQSEMISQGDCRGENFFRPSRETIYQIPDLLGKTEVASGNY